MILALPNVRRRGFTLLELLTAVAIILILAALLLPALQSGYGKAKRVACASNLKQVGTAFHVWAHDHGDLFPMQVSTNQSGTREFAEAAALNPDVSVTFRHFQAISNDLVLPKLLACPADKQRIAAKNFESLRNENVSYWINPAAAFGHTDSPLAGDRNVRTSGRTEWSFIQFNPSDSVEFSAELHGHRGNVLFGDAHVDVFDSRTLRLAFASSNGADVTISIPRPDTTDPSNDGGSSTVASGASSSGEASSSASRENARSAATTASPSSKSNSNIIPNSPGRIRGSGSPGERENEIVVVTRFDGTVVTSSVPRKVTNAAPSTATSGSENEPTNPIIAFLQWLTRVSASGTYWLLFLLLLALIAFEIARRRAKHKRKRID
jgi:prepilin-type N-terminal cleavage/methylation domain-containing protein/prepilin-type processing-associated H-X9-DG protein